VDPVPPDLRLRPIDGGEGPDLSREQVADLKADPSPADPDLSSGYASGPSDDLVYYPLHQGLFADAGNAG